MKKTPSLLMISSCALVSALLASPLLASPQAAPQDPQQSRSTIIMPPRNSYQQPVPPSGSLDDYATARLKQAEQESLVANGSPVTDPAALQGYPPLPQNGLNIPPGMVAPSQPVAPPAPKRPPSPADEQAEARALWEFDPKQSLRQSGGKLEQPTHHGFFFSKSDSDQDLLNRWIYTLKNEGVSEDKIIFEAKRLDKDRFEMWASRFIWWEQSLHPNVVRPNF